MAQDSRDIALPYLRAWREQRIMTQGELAERAGITSATISRIENGAGAKLRTIARLADALGISREQLIRSQPESVAA